MIPIRCFTCGKPIGHLWDKYNKELATGREAKEVFERIGIERYCCRTLFLTHVDWLSKAARYKK
ncbi:MAG: DNA-directed RNA polymerase subunit N [Candidatus Aenigmarchaeota archaeon]|nr:DNA-directed RNA polymerase subunit N [Candidatus Aenigmarchaeota archaeon]